MSNSLVNETLTQDNISDFNHKIGCIHALDMFLDIEVLKDLMKTEEEIRDV